MGTIGHSTWEIADRLGYHYGDEVVHRDDLVVLLPANGTSPKVV